MSIAQIQADHIEKLATELRRLERENNKLLADKKRLDWLADPGNCIGNVQLPSACVLANLHSLRDAIDMAMRIAGARNV